MHNIIFYFKDGVLFGRYIDLAGKATNLSTKKCKLIIRELEKDKALMTNFKSGNSLHFDAGNIHFILRNQEAFKHLYDFRYVFKRRKDEKYKIVKKTTKKVIAIGLSATIAVSVLSLLAKMTIDNITNESSYSEELDEEKDEDIEEDNEIDNFNYVDSNENNEKENIEKEEQIQGIINQFDIGSKVDSKDAIETRNQYYNKIKTYCEKNNVNPDIICAIATQEQGRHDPDAPGSAIGLMQIEKVHIGEVVHIYNEEGELEEIHITEEALKDEDINIKVGIAIFKQCLKEFNWNYFLAIEAYNKGIDAINRVLKRCSEATGISVEDLKNNILYLIWYNYITSDEKGDSKYTNHVGPYIPPNVMFGLLMYDGYLDNVSLDEIKR